MGLTGSANDYCLLIHFEGSARGVIWQTAQALRIARERMTNDCMTLEEGEDFWRKLSAAPVQLDDNLIWRAALKPSDLLSFVDEVASLEKDDSSHVSLRWHAGLTDGRLRAIAQAPVYHREAVRQLRRLRYEVEKRGGCLVLEKAPLEIKQEFDSWGTFGAAGDLMRRVKQQLDPQNLFSPGRFFS